MTSRKFFIALLFILSCQEKVLDNPFDPQTELNPDDWQPSSLTIEILTDSDVKLSWQKSEIEATGFKVERQDTTGGAFVEIGTVDTTIYTDTALIVGNEYLYQVCAYSGDNQSSYATSSDTIVTSFPAPYDMAAVPDTNSMIVLAWNDSTSYESGFVIQRKNIVSDAFTVLDSIAQNTYQDSTVTLGNEYVYKVGAYSEYNTSSYTDTASVKYWQDCNDTWGGDALEDNCGTCDSDSSNDCNMDCNDTWGGDALEDNCGVCGGDNSPLTGTCDCNGTPNGEAYTDGCGDCVGGLTEKEACANDCLGVLGGDAVYDNCNTCDNDPENDCTQDCAGTWGGDLVDDTCGVCGGDNSPSTGTCDCEGTPNGTLVEDCAGVCGGTSGLSGCDNVCNSTAEIDCAGVCGGTNFDADSDGICDEFQGTVSDVDGNTYKTIKIGEQWWMAENLNTAMYKTGEGYINSGLNDSEWASTTDGAYAVYNNNSSNADVYGKLYNWYAVENQQVCMDGWHVPSDAEFTELTDYLGGESVAGGKMKEEGLDHWNSPNTGATNESGFSAFGGGSRREDGYYHNLNNEGLFFTSTLDNNNPKLLLLKNQETSTINPSESHKNGGFAVRCLEDVVLDCAGVPGGSAVEDCTGLCGGTHVDSDCGTVSDIDLNTYKTIKIGDQWWMAENLKTTKYKDGSEIPNITNNGGWGSLTTGAYAVYDDNLSNADVYGNLYNLYAADNQQVCMEGWHVPSDEEWTILTDYLGGESVAGGKMKETGTEHWCGDDSENCINEGATNESGFTGLPAGSRNHSGSDGGMGSAGIFWTSSPEEGNSIYTWWRYLYSGNSAVWRSYDSFVNYGFSIRCLEGAAPDCAGVPGGDAVEDCAGVCGGDGSIAGDGYVLLWDECYNIEETTVLYLPLNQLTGEIPPEIGSLTNLTELLLENNQLTGEIPPEIGNLINLIVLDLRNNQLTGEIPPEIGNLPNLTGLLLHSNQLTGVIPVEIGNLPNLTGLWLYNNQLTGVIPEEICNIGDSTPELANNQLCPPYPSCITEEDIGTQDISACPVQDCAGTWGGIMVDANSDGFCDEWVDLTITDVDANSYETVQIGTQLWMAENLKVTHYNDGSEIPSGPWWSEIETGAYANYDNNPTNSDTYGRLYNWYAVEDSRGICPEGFHVPTDAEYTILTVYLGGGPGGKMKECTEGSCPESEFWDYPNLGATNESGFTALPAGVRSEFEVYGDVGMGIFADFWSSSEYVSDDSEAWKRQLHYQLNDGVACARNTRDKNAGHSIRCLRN